MTDTWQKLGDITAQIITDLDPITFSVTLSRPLADAVKKVAAEEGSKPETLMAEAVRAYMGETA